MASALKTTMIRVVVLSIMAASHDRTPTPPTGGGSSFCKPPWREPYHGSRRDSPRGPDLDRYMQGCSPSQSGSGQNNINKEYWDSGESPQPVIGLSWKQRKWTRPRLSRPPKLSPGPAPPLASTANSDNDASSLNRPPTLPNHKNGHHRNVTIGLASRSSPQRHHWPLK